LLAADFADYTDLIPGFNKPFPAERCAPKVQDKGYFQAGSLQIRQRLSEMEIENAVNGLQFDDDGVIDDYV
jgi:hypothetical protein